MTNPWAAPEPPPWPVRSSPTQLWLRDLRAALLVGGVTLLLAAPAGLAWAALAPHVGVDVVGPDQAGIGPAEREDFLGADLTFLVVGLATGLLAGLVLALGPVAAWARRHAPGALLGLVLAGLAGGFAAAEVGSRVGVADFRDTVLAGAAAQVDAPVRLYAQEVVVAWPVGALAGFLVPVLLRPRGRSL